MKRLKFFKGHSTQWLVLPVQGNPKPKLDHRGREGNIGTDQLPGRHQEGEGLVAYHCLILDAYFDTCYHLSLPCTILFHIASTRTPRYDCLVPPPPREECDACPGPAAKVKQFGVSSEPYVSVSPRV